MSDNTIIAPDTGITPEPRKPLRKRTWFWVTGGLIAVAVIGGIAAGASGGSKPAASPNASAPASQAPSSPPAPSASDTPSATAPSPMDTWCTGTGYSEYQTVQDDLTQLRTDLGNGDIGTAENADATKLTSDAETAMKDAPPGTKDQKTNYVEYMGSLSFMAIDLNTGNITGATNALHGSQNYQPGVDSLVAACG
jgi:hypothetical protein